jgi:hypothetical protein
VALRKLERGYHGLRVLHADLWPRHSRWIPQILLAQGIPCIRFLAAANVVLGFTGVPW